MVVISTNTLVEKQTFQIYIATIHTLSQTLDGGMIAFYFFWLIGNMIAIISGPHECGLIL